MEDKTYVIKYEIILKGGNSIKDKEIKIRKCSSGVHAQCRLEEYLQKKHEDFKQLVVSSCEEDILSMFDNLFGTSSSNPFSGQFGGKDWPFR